MKYSDAQIQILRYLAECQNSSLQWKAGDVVQVPSPAIEGRTDNVVVFFAHKGGSSGNDAAGLVVRNKGRYSNKKSLELARRLSAIMEELDLGVGSVENYDTADSSARMAISEQWVQTMMSPICCSYLISNMQRLASLDDGHDMEWLLDALTTERECERCEGTGEIDTEIDTDDCDHCVEGD